MTVLALNEEQETIKLSTIATCTLVVATPNTTNSLLSKTGIVEDEKKK